MLVCQRSVDRETVLDEKQRVNDTGSRECFENSSRGKLRLMKDDCREQNRVGNDLPDLLTSCPILTVSWSSLLGQGDSPGSQSSQTGIFGIAVDPILGGLIKLET
jgi:hypothetical protein